MNAMVVAWSAELTLRLHDCGRGEVAFLHPGIPDGADRSIEVVVGVVKGMESKNVPARDPRSTSDALAYGDERLDLVQPSQRDTFRRHEVVKGGNHDRGGR